MSVQMTPVASEAVARIGYDEAAHDVHVEFAGGRTYVYMGVPPSAWERFEAAESKGEFVNRVLKPGYAVRRV